MFRIVQVYHDTDDKTCYYILYSASTGSTIHSNLLVDKQILRGACMMNSVKEVIEEAVWLTIGIVMVIILFIYVKMGGEIDV